MNRSGQLHSKNDNLVLEIIKDPLYKFTSDGFIYTRIAKTGKVFVNIHRWRRAGTISNRGSYVISFKGVKLSVARIIYAKFLAGRAGNPQLEPDLMIGHKNFVLTDNATTNLKLVPQSEINTERLREFGSIIGNRKLNWTLVKEIRLAYQYGSSLRTLADKYDVRKSTVSAVVNNKTWVEGRNYHVSSLNI